MHELTTSACVETTVTTQAPRRIVSQTHWLVVGLRWRRRSSAAVPFRCCKDYPLQHLGVADFRRWTASTSSMCAWVLLSWWDNGVRGSSVTPAAMSCRNRIEITSSLSPLSTRTTKCMTYGKISHCKMSRSRHTQWKIITRELKAECKSSTEFGLLDDIEINGK